MELTEEMKRKIQRIVEDTTLRLADEIRSRRAAEIAAKAPPPQPRKSQWVEELEQELLELEDVKGGSR